MTESGSVRTHAPALAALAMILAAGALLGGEAIARASALSEVPGALAEDKDQPVVTFSSFQAHDDGSASIRVDMTRAAEVTHEQKGTSVRFVIQKARIRWKNNKNALRAEFFQSNVLSTKLDQTKQGVVLTVNLRTETSTSFRVVTHSAGASLHVDVPPPKPPEKQPEAAVR